MNSWPRITISPPTTTRTTKPTAGGAGSSGRDSSLRSIAERLTSSVAAVAAAGRHHRHFLAALEHGGSNRAPLPGRSTTSFTRSVPIQMPLPLPRSTMCSPSAPCSTRACRRDTLSSCSTSAHDDVTPDLDAVADADLLADARVLVRRR
jgi:hypothetical protein